MTLETDLATWLAGQGVGTLASSIFVESFPSDVTPNPAVCVRVYGGRGRDNARNILRPLVQITARAASYSAAQAKAWQVLGLLDHRGPTVMGSTGVHDAHAAQEPIPLGQGEDQAYRFTINFQFWIGG